MAFLEHGDHRIAYEVLGKASAPPVILIMGLGLPSRAWHTLPERLAESFRVIVFDNRGTGASTLPPGVFRIAHLADDAARVLDAVGAKRAHVFGLSMGGMIALELALRHPERVESLVLGATFAGYLRSRKPNVGAMRDLLLSVLSKRPRDAAVRLARLLVSTPYVESNADAFTGWLVATGRTKVQTTSRQMLAVLFHTTEARLAKLDVPTLVLTGDADRLVPPENSRALARRIPGATLVELPGAGHCFPLEREDETVRLLQSWFGRRSTA